MKKTELFWVDVTDVQRGDFKWPLVATVVENVRDETALWGYEFSSLAKEGFHDNLSWRVFTVPSYINIYMNIFI